MSFANFEFSGVRAWGDSLHLPDPITDYHGLLWLLAALCLGFAVALVRQHRRAIRQRADLRLANRRLSMATSVAGVGVWEWLPDSQRLTWNPVMFELHGCEPSRPTSRQEWESLLVPESRAKFAAMLTRREATSGELELGAQRLDDGRVCWLRTSYQWLEGGGERRLVGTQVDVTETHATMRRLFREAYLDALTGLLNKRALYDHQRQFTAGDERRQGRQALLYLDLDGFKQVNDTWGHQAGDALLQSVARRLRSCLRQEDQIYRLGGDEFAVWVRTDIDDAAAPGHIASKLVGALSQPYDLDDCRCDTVSASIGIACYPQDARSLDALLEVADAAMYQAKRGGKNRYQFYRNIKAVAPAQGVSAA